MRAPRGGGDLPGRGGRRAAGTAGNSLSRRGRDPPVKRGGRADACPAGRERADRADVGDGRRRAAPATARGRGFGYFLTAFNGVAKAKAGRLAEIGQVPCVRGLGLKPDLGGGGLV